MLLDCGLPMVASVRRRPSQERLGSWSGSSQAHPYASRSVTWAPGLMGLFELLASKVAGDGGGHVGQPATGLGGEMAGESRARMLSRPMTVASVATVSLLKVSFAVLASLSLLLRGKL